MNFTKNALDLFFPPRCGVCGKIGTVLCNSCEEKIEKYKINLIERKDGINIFYLYRYGGIIRELLIKYKFGDKSYLADTFVKIMLKNKKLFRFLKNYDIIIPVPLHRKRKLERGYNQVELIAKKLGRIETNCLIKNKNTKPQSVKNLSDRIKDVKGIYEIKNIEKIKGKRVLIFDDIYTTGSTVNECIKTISRVTNKIGVLIIAKDYMEVKVEKFSTNILP